VTEDHLLDEVRDANLSYMILAQKLVRSDRALAMYRLGINEETADLLEAMSTAQMLRIAASNMLLCRFRFDDEIVWRLITSHEKSRGTGQTHAAILLASALPAAA
jgi:flagellar transcriptional activator FlhD